ncbi:hypothetical protein G3I76_39870, partial [Streptomyces sp. SID11233]|nr:hypothetical protein [Streptomyces sp. SID11233]
MPPERGARGGPATGTGSDTLVLKRVPAPGETAATNAGAAGKPGAEAGGAAGKAAAKRRDPFFDNAKYLAILLVAMGHAWEPLRGDSRAASALYIFVYTFHMPAFIII